MLVKISSGKHNFSSMIQQITCSGFMEPILEPLLSSTATAFHTTWAGGILCSECSVFGLTQQRTEKSINTRTTVRQGMGRKAEEVNAKTSRCYWLQEYFSSPHNISVAGSELLWCRPVNHNESIHREQREWEPKYLILQVQGRAREKIHSLSVGNLF